MNIKRFLIVIFIVLSLFISVILVAFNGKSEGNIDVTEVNDVIQSIADQWGRLEQGKLPGLQYGFDYVVIDNNNNYVIATRNGLNSDMNHAISNRDTIVDIKSNNTIVGKLIIYNNTSKIWQQYRTNLLTFNFIIVILIAIICLAYVIYLDKIIFHPFRKLQGFARYVAEGKLDVPLEMDKSNMFGAFTESFDLMRVELNKARENERIANQSKKELVASLSHDIKTPIASIKAVTEVMHAKTKDEKIRSQLEIINTKADQINTLITNMFNATLEELQELKVTVTEQSSQILYDLIKSVDYNNKVTVSGICECVILADELRLAQVVDNVISNSYKYAGTSISVTTQIINKYLIVEFKDYGLGVPDDELPLIFSKFYRAKNAAGKSGTGLGLYISKFLMSKMGGDIECENAEDGFVVKLKILIA